MRYADKFCQVTENFEPIHTYTFTGICLGTQEKYSVTVKGVDLNKYREGAYIQDAFPYLSADDREFLISGYSPEGWKKTFGSDEDEGESFIFQIK